MDIPPFSSTERILAAKAWWHSMVLDLQEPWNDDFPWRPFAPHMFFCFQWFSGTIRYGELLKLGEVFNILFFFGAIFCGWYHHHSGEYLLEHVPSISSELHCSKKFARPFHLKCTNPKNPDPSKVAFQLFWGPGLVRVNLRRIFPNQPSTVTCPADGRYINDFTPQACNLWVDNQRDPRSSEYCHEAPAAGVSRGIPWGFYKKPGSWKYGENMGKP